jgi:hypothetical protein
LRLAFVIGKTAGEQQNAPFSHKFPAGLGRREPEPVSLHRNVERVVRRQIELLPQRLGNHHPSGLVNWIVPFFMAFKMPFVRRKWKPFLGLILFWRWRRPPVRHRVRRGPRWGETHPNEDPPPVSNPPYFCFLLSLFGHFSVFDLRAGGNYTQPHVGS